MGIPRQKPRVVLGKNTQHRTRGENCARLHAQPELIVLDRELSTQHRVSLSSARSYLPTS